MRDQWIEWAIELQSIAQAGLFYTEGVYDKERYERLREIAADMMAAKVEDLPAEKVKDLFCAEIGYQTPKVDTRAVIIKDDKILLVQEANGKWSMPGGWCDVCIAPADNAVKEAKEEAGRDVRVKSVIAIQDHDKHNTHPYAFGIVRIFYLCEDLGGEFIPNVETLQAEYFSEDELPDNFSTDKTNEEQIKMCFEAYRNENWKVPFD